MKSFYQSIFVLNLTVLIWALIYVEKKRSYHYSSSIEKFFVSRDWGDVLSYPLFSGLISIAIFLLLKSYNVLPNEEPRRENKVVSDSIQGKEKEFSEWLSKDPARSYLSKESQIKSFLKSINVDSNAGLV